jgi:hypothetical protein
MIASTVPIYLAETLFVRSYLSPTILGNYGVCIKEAPKIATRLELSNRLVKVTFWHILTHQILPDVFPDKARTILHKSRPSGMLQFLPPKVTGGGAETVCPFRPWFILEPLPEANKIPAILC